MARRALDGTPKITSRHGDRTLMGFFQRHLGYDYGVGVGTPVYAPEAGSVSTSKGASGGNTIELTSGKYVHRLLHLSRFNVVTGQTVKEGQLIGWTGNTGITTGAHLHHDTRYPSAWNSKFENYVDWEALLAAPQSSTPKTLYLKPTTSAYAFYRPGTPLPVKRANRAGDLNPKKYGGLTYSIIRQVAANVYEVKSPSLGVIWIWAGDSDSEVK